MATIIARYPFQMRVSSASPLQILSRGSRLLWKHPLQTLAICAVTAGLAALAPYLQIRTGLPDHQMTTLILLQVATLPLELYFIPRLILQLDAETCGDAQNPLADWKTTFESRWLKAFGAKLLFSLAVAAGASCFIVPGLVLIFLFGWMPLRVLLRGETLGEGMRSSMRIMARTWPRTLAVGCSTLGLYLLAALLLAALAASRLPNPSLWQRTVHPIMWGSNFIAGLLSLWVSTIFLALYQQVEIPRSMPA